MIKPKYTLNKREFKIAEEFIDRENAKLLYREKMLNNRKEYNILAFYGVGGIGKSKLRKELCRLHKEEHKHTIIFNLDFNIAEDRVLGSGILKLVASCDTKIAFKAFETAYSLYFKKKNPGMSFERKRYTVTENIFASSLLNIISIFDSGITKTAATILERIIRSIINQSIDNSIKKELRHFDDCSISEMEEKLPLFFQYDLMSYLETHRDTGVLIVFDTFEALNENVIEPAHRSNNERWVKEVIKYFDFNTFPKLLILLFGREKLDWGYEWNNIIDQHRLEEFDDTYSKKYLIQAGIVDPQIIDTVTRESKGYPLFLYLSAETYISIKNSGFVPTPEDFGRSYQEIIERFLSKLDKETVESLKLLSIPNYYNSLIFSELIKKFNVPFPLTEFQQFNKYSFVNYDKDEDRYYIHKIIREHIIKAMSLEQRRDIHKFLLEYFSKQITDTIEVNFLLQIFYHAKNCFTINQFNIWSSTSLSESISKTPSECLKILQSQGELTLLTQIFSYILKEDMDDQFTLKEMTFELANMYIDIIHLSGNYKEAYERCAQYLAGKDFCTNSELQGMFCRKIHYGMFWCRPQVLLRELDSLDISQIKLNSVKCEYLIAKYNLLILAGEFNSAFDIVKLVEPIATYDLEPNNKYWLRIQRKKIDLNALNGKFNLPENLRYINPTIAKHSTRYEIYLLGSMAENYRQNEELDTAYEYYLTLQNHCKKRGIRGWLAHSYLGKAAIHIQRKEFNDAVDNLTNADEIYNQMGQIWGILNVKILRCFLGVARQESIETILSDSKKIALEYGYNYYKNFLSDVKLLECIKNFRLLFL